VLKKSTEKLQLKEPIGIVKKKINYHNGRVVGLQNEHLSRRSSVHIIRIFIYILFEVSIDYIRVYLKFKVS